MSGLNGRQFRISYDVGGTFTDLVVTDLGSGTYVVRKVPTRYGDSTAGLREDVASLLDRARLGAGDVTEPTVGATTLFTNALLERRGARTALVATKGFGDVLVLGRERRYDLYDLAARLPEPLVPDELTLEVEERTAADGAVLEPLRREDVARLAAALVESGAEAVAISLLHSYRNAAHERAVAETLAELRPELPVTCSADVAPEIREFERTQTTAANAYLLPLAIAHVDAANDALQTAGIDTGLVMMQSLGGVIDSEVAARLPVRLLESGPVAGTLAAAYWGRQLGIDDLLAFDMGGTSAKVSLVSDGRPTVAPSFEAARQERHERGSGFQLLLPVVDLIEISAGGGSIASVDALGLLQVGPESAGSVPGPACYGRGGTLPTVTDADLVLGYLIPEYFLQGEMRLDADAAVAALESIAAPLGASVIEAAASVLDLVNESMALAIQVHAAERGRDVADLALVAFGGAGPVHAAHLARRLGIGRVVIPANAGVLAATGLQVAPATTHLARSRLVRLEAWNPDDARAFVDDLKEVALEQLGGLASVELAWDLTLDMRYRGQGSAIPVPVPHPIGELAADDLYEVFTGRYEATYGRQVTGTPVDVVTWRLRGTALASELRLAPSRRTPTGMARPETSHQAWFAELGFVDVPVVLDSELDVDESLRGPVIIQQSESTVVVGPGDTVRADDLGHLHLQIGRS